MAIQCPKCRRQYDVTLFQFRRTVRCECGTWLDLRAGHTSPACCEEPAEPPGGEPADGAGAEEEDAQGG